MLVHFLSPFLIQKVISLEENAERRASESILWDAESSTGRGAYVGEKGDPECSCGCCTEQSPSICDGGLKR